MIRTTEQWKQLLDGTTEGPWFANMRGFGRIENIGPISTGFSIGDGLDCDEDGAILAAHSPTAVAEVIRLREALEVWRGKVKTIPYDGEAITACITRILEGEEK